MRKLLITAVLIVSATAAADAQSITTNCTSYVPNNVQCTTTAPPSVDWGAFQRQQQQQQQQLNQAFQNLGAAIAARRERKREEKAAAEAQAQLDAIKGAIQRALDADTATASPPPTDEPPVLLVCNINNSPSSIALYEKHHRADVTAGGVTRTRLAVF